MVGSKNGSGGVLGECGVRQVSKDGKLDQAKVVLEVVENRWI